MKSCQKTDLANQVVTYLLWINNLSLSTGLYKIRRESVPNIFLEQCDIPYIIRGVYVYAQMSEPLTALTLRLWNLHVYKMFIRSIIVPIESKHASIIDSIGTYLGAYVEYKTMTIRMIE